MSIKIEGFEYKDLVESSKYGIIAEIHKAEKCSLYWIRFLKEVNGNLELITIRIRNDFAANGLEAIKSLIREELFAEVVKGSKNLEAVNHFNFNHNNKTEVDMV